MDIQGMIICICAVATAIGIWAWAENDMKEQNDAIKGREIRRRCAFSLNDGMKDAVKDRQWLKQECRNKPDHGKRIKYISSIDISETYAEPRQHNGG